MTTERPLPPPSPQVPGLRAALATTTVLGGLAAVVAVLGGGRPELYGVTAGVALVVGFFVLGTVSTSVVAAHAPRISLLVALLTYTLQVVLLALVLVTVERSGIAERGLDVGWLAGTVVAGTLAWTTALVVDALRRTHPLPTGETHG